ncbi:MAG: GNAT family N-acetyltransferase [Erysipelotrichaceae bacterium]|nr:GNAT family N-acetyltransferase [Erysipelotrichaceae bacterium]
MIDILLFTRDKIKDVIEFEKELRKQEPNTYFWEIDDDYIASLAKSFDSPRFINAISLLAYKEEKVIGRIDATLLCTFNDPKYETAYLDWICVLKNERHHKVAQALLHNLKLMLKEKGVNTLVALIANNDEAIRFYNSIDDAEIHDQGIWINVK